MPGIQLLMAPGDKVYQYDGSLAGFYTCIQACVHTRQIPLAIQTESEAQLNLFSCRRIGTDSVQAHRVRNAISDKISPRALQLCEHVFLSCLVEKELTILRFLILGFQKGHRIIHFLTDPIVHAMLKTEKSLFGEAHLLSGFIRFSDQEGKLIAVINPKNYVLPLLAPHFVDRYAMETFLIYDRTHRVALAYERGHAELVGLEGEFIPDYSEAELFYQALWTQFYQTIAIRERENHRCRMTHMPKRYWENMVELRGSSALTQPLPQ